MAKHLTAKAIERLRPDPNQRLEIPDGLLPGLYFVIQPSGTKSWAVRYRVNGQSAKLTLGRFPAIGLAQARDMGRAKLQEVANGRDPAAEKRATKGVSQTLALPTTVNALCDLYVEQHLKKNVRRWWGARGEIDNHIRPRVGNLALSDLTRAHVRELVREIGETRPVAANRALARLRAVLNWGIAEDLIEANVAAGIKRPTREIPVDRVLSDAELRTVWEASASLAYPAQQFARLLVLSGQRRDDVRLMHWDEVDLESRAWVIPAARYKGRHPHLVPLSAAMLEILEGLPFRDRGGYVLSLDGGTRAYSSTQRPKRALDKVAKVTGWTWHDLRRTLRTGLSRLGIREDVAERVIGHAVGGRLGQTYNLYDFSEEKRAALNAWAAHVQGLATENVVPIQRAVN